MYPEVGPGSYDPLRAVKALDAKRGYTPIDPRSREPEHWIGDADSPPPSALRARRRHSPPRYRHSSSPTRHHTPRQGENGHHAHANSGRRGLEDPEDGAGADAYESFTNGHYGHVAASPARQQRRSPRTYQAMHGNGAYTGSRNGERGRPATKWRSHRR